MKHILCSILSISMISNITAMHDRSIITRIHGGILHGDPSAIQRALDKSCVESRPTQLELGTLIQVAEAQKSTLDINRTIESKNAKWPDFCIGATCVTIGFSTLLFSSLAKQSNEACYERYLDFAAESMCVGTSLITMIFGGATMLESLLYKTPQERYENMVTIVRMLKDYQMQYNTINA